jgi:hypothetical protein
VSPADDAVLNIDDDKSRVRPVLEFAHGLALLNAGLQYLSSLESS